MLFLIFKCVKDISHICLFSYKSESSYLPKITSYYYCAINVFLLMFGTEWFIRVLNSDSNQLSLF